MLWWCLYLENLFPFHYHYPIRSPVGSSLRNIITKNESFNRNSPFSYGATTEMLQMPHFVAKHRILVEIYIDNYALYSDWILPPLCK